MRIIIILFVGLFLFSCGKKRTILITATNGASGDRYAGLQYFVVSSTTTGSGEKYKTEKSGFLNEYSSEENNSNTIGSSRKNLPESVIYIGTVVTPSTPIGPYTLAPNADLVLSAGEYLVIDSIFETEFGTQFTASIDYEQCNPNKSAPSSGDSDDFEAAAVSRFLIEERKQVLEETIDDEGFTIYPNPTNGKFKLSCTSSIKVVTCHTITGLVVYRLETDSRD